MAPWQAGQWGPVAERALADLDCSIKIFTFIKRSAVTTEFAQITTECNGVHGPRDWLLCRIRATRRVVHALRYCSIKESSYTLDHQARGDGAKRSGVGALEKLATIRRSNADPGVTNLMIVHLGVVRLHPETEHLG